MENKILYHNNVICDVKCEKPNNLSDLKNI